MANKEFATDFDLVWAQFPRKTAKAVARKAWNKLNPDAETVQAMLDALIWQKQTLQWQKGIIPHFSTWLNQARWEDEPPACHCKPEPVGEILELAKSIARANAEQAEQGQHAIERREQELIGQGLSPADAVMQASREWLRAQR